MIELNIYPIIGLYNELYEPNLGSLSLDKMTANGRWALARTNGLFWGQHFQRSHLEELIEKAKAKFRFTSCNVAQYEAVLSDPELFMQQVADAPRVLANAGASPQSFFAATETLAILCRLYFDFVYSPFKLTVQEGFLLDEYSSKQLVEQCLVASTNPYLGFILENCWSVIQEMKPDLIWLLGPIRFSTFTMAMLARDAFPSVHISIVGHSSEYYSLNKITKYLKSNEVLFSVIDSIVLDDTEHSQQRLVECLKEGHPLDFVPNLLYIDHKQGIVKETQYKVTKKDIANWIALRPRSFSEQEAQENTVDPSKVVNVKMWPDTKCYWNRCTFCGINHKYHTIPDQNRFENMDATADFIANLADQGCKYFWSIDEAVPPETLEKFAQELLARNLNVYWQARSRIDGGFSQAVCDTLAKAGLREIRLGLESACSRILKLMDKFPDDFDLALVEKIVSRFDRSGVSVHFPIIIGFPTETSAERMETFEFLRNLKGKYPSVTFNVNSLGLDVSSRLFKRYEEFDITELKWTCPSRFFLGNLIDWDSDVEHFDKNLVDDQRNQFMRRVLYPWMPKTALTPTYIFYRLSETSRITLVWKSHVRDDSDNARAALMLSTKICASPNLVHWRLTGTSKKAKELYRIYDWDTHNTIDCDEEGLRILNIFKEAQTIQSGLSCLQTQLGQDSSSLDQVTAKYLPQLRVAFQRQMMRLA